MTSDIPASLVKRCIGISAPIRVVTLDGDYGDAEATYRAHCAKVSSLRQSLSAGDSEEWSHEAIDADGSLRVFRLIGVEIVRSEKCRAVPITDAATLHLLVGTDANAHEDTTEETPQVRANNRRGYARKLIFTAMGHDSAKSWKAAGYPIDMRTLLASGEKAFRNEVKASTVVADAGFTLAAGTGSIPCMTTNAIRPGTRDTGRTMGQGSFNN